MYSSSDHGYFSGIVGIKLYIYENYVRFVFCLTAGMLANNLGQSGHISLTYLVGAVSAAQGYYHHGKYILKSFSFIQIFSLRYSFTFTLLVNHRPRKVSKYNKIKRSTVASKVLNTVGKF